jgi:hemerythrin-like domain-containing protein
MQENQTATSGLRAEHQWILKVAGALEEILSRGTEEGLDFDAIEECVDFIRLFADACHHGQEEDLLFPALEARGMPRDAGPIAVMLHEHQMGRAFVQRMVRSMSEARQGNAEAGAILVNSAHGYIQLIRAHIKKEDNVLFNLADRSVTGAPCRKLCQDYEVVCQRRFEGRSKEELEELAHSLVGRYGKGPVDTRT